MVVKIRGLWERFRRSIAEPVAVTLLMVAAYIISLGMAATLVNDMALTFRAIAVVCLAAGGLLGAVTAWGGKVKPFELVAAALCGCGWTVYGIGLAVLRSSLDLPQARAIVPIVLAVLFFACRYAQVSFQMKGRAEPQDVRAAREEAERERAEYLTIASQLRAAQNPGGMQAA
ncbi:hypothetical protein ACU19_04965 [Actinobaculum suis]|uniref:hypothetical protein n=1 Tax=Actinobaculum suis TaxID=1657 RepID=UPI00066FF12E|nr:hypothetical protein [Actinobaculum suis]KMY23325.1 hypothetical protein ACU19_04965 [Actinobaculum suis]